MAKIEHTRDRVFNTLFLCTGNSARSIIAEAVLNRVGHGRFRAFSAGSHPTGTVNPHALGILRKSNYATDGLRSKDWSEFGKDVVGAPRLDFIFTVCDDAAGEVCPVWPGQPVTAHWGLPDPAAVTGSAAETGIAFADTLRMLRARISIFTSLPIGSLDRLSLLRQLSHIGASVPLKENI